MIFDSTGAEHKHRIIVFQAVAALRRNAILLLPTFGVVLDGQEVRLDAILKTIVVVSRRDVKAQAAARIHFRDFHFPRRIAMKARQRKVFHVDVYHILAVMWVKVNEFVVLVADEIQRMLWSSADNSDTPLKAEHRLQAITVNRIQSFVSQTQWNQENQRLPRSDFSLGT